MKRYKAELSREGETGQATLHAEDQATARSILEKEMGPGVTIGAIEEIPEAVPNLEWVNRMDAPDDPSKQVILPVITG